MELSTLYVSHWPNGLMDKRLVGRTDTPVVTIIPSGPQLTIDIQFNSVKLVSWGQTWQYPKRLLAF